MKICSKSLSWLACSVLALVTACVGKKDYTPLPEDIRAIFPVTGTFSATLPDSGGISSSYWKVTAQQLLKQQEYSKNGGGNYYDMMDVDYIHADTLGLDSLGVPLVEQISISLRVDSRRGSPNNNSAELSCQYRINTGKNQFGQANYEDAYASNYSTLEAAAVNVTIPGKPVQRGLQLAATDNYNYNYSYRNRLLVDKALYTQGIGLYELRARVLDSTQTTIKRFVYKR